MANMKFLVCVCVCFFKIDITSDDEMVKGHFMMYGNAVQYVSKSPGCVKCHDTSGGEQDHFFPQSPRKILHPT